MVRSNDWLYYPTYSFLTISIYCLFLFYLNKTKISQLISFINFFKYLLLFYLLDIFFQVFYHNVSISNILAIFASHSVAISSIYIFSKMLKTKSDFIKINTYIFYLLNLSLIIGIFDSVGLINLKFLTPTKLIESYNFGIFSNTSGLLEHQISFGISMTLLFGISTMLKKNNFIYLLMISLGVFISFSRTAYLVYFIILLYFLYFKAIINRYIILGSIFILIISLLFIDFSQIDFINNLLRLEKGLSGREFIIATYFLIPWTINDFLFGLGYENIYGIRDSILTDFEYGLKGMQFQAIHNLYLSTIGNSGLLLALLYFLSQFLIYFRYIANKYLLYNYITIFMIIFFLGNLFVEFKVGGLRIISLYFSMLFGFIYSQFSKVDEIQQ